MILKFRKNISEWYSLYANAIKNRLRRDLNLGDVCDVQETRDNIGLSGDNNHTHYHDDRYIPIIEKRINELDNKLNNIIPIGTIITWPSNVPPDTYRWLECNGQSFDTTEYPDLYKVFPNGRVPDLREKFLEGHNVAGTNISPGLPSFYAGVEGSVRANEGKNNTWYYYRAGMYHEVREYFSLLKDFNISVNGENVSVNVTKEYLPFIKGNLWTIPNYQNQTRTDVMSTGAHNINLAGANLYGKASTVQPNSFTVKFYIRAK